MDPNLLLGAIVTLIVWGAWARTRYRSPKRPGEPHGYSQHVRQSQYNKARKSKKWS
jgi:hypothetical protein